MRHVVTHPYRPTPWTAENVVWALFVLALLTVITVMYQSHAAQQRQCVRDLTTAWSAAPENVDRTLPDYAWFEERCR